MRAFPKVTDALQDPLAGYLPRRAREAWRRQVADLFDGAGERLSPPAWFARYCQARRIPMRDVVPRAGDVREAGLLLAAAVRHGWAEDAPGPRGGRGWRLTQAGCAPVPGRAPRARRVRPG